MAAAPPAAELRSADRADLDAGLLIFRIVASLRS